MRSFIVISSVFLLLFLSLSAALAAQKAYDPSPADQQTDVPLRPVFRWKYEGDSCNVYAGLEKDDLRLLISGTTSTEFQPDSDLPPETVFFWRIDVNDGDRVIEGDIWAFKTESILDANGCSLGSLSGSIMLLLLPLFWIVLKS